MSTPDFADLALRHGTPYYSYEESVIASRLALLRQTFPGFVLLYSVKTNPHPAICRFMAANGAGADAASSYEVRRALEAGFAPEDIVYSAPGKTMDHLRDALGRCVITADSYTELERLNVLAGEVKAGKDPLAVGLRINPDMAFGPGEFAGLTSGTSAKFGVDEESLAARKDFLAGLTHLRLAGLHVFLRSQVLNHAALASMFERVFGLALFCRDDLGWDLSYINFGGGLGIGPDPNQGLDLDALRLSMETLVRRYAPLLPGCRLMLESGRFLVGSAGTFVTRIEDVKESRGTTFVIAPGCLNGFLRPAIMQFMGNLPFPVTGPFEPLYSNEAAHGFCLPGKSGDMKRVSICGNLCTALDIVARDVLLPDPQIGDLLTISNAGAYAATLSPFAFGSFPRPPEVYLDANGAEFSA